MVRTHYIPASKPAPAAETHQSIEEQTRAFLSGGGKINSFPLGATAQMGISTKEYTVASQQVINKHKLAGKKLH